MTRHSRNAAPPRSPAHSEASRQPEGVAPISLPVPPHPPNPAHPPRPPLLASPRTLFSNIWPWLTLYGFFILENTLIPFDFSGQGAAKQRVLAITFSRIPWTDIAVNLCLFFPLGWLGFEQAVRRGMRPLAAIGLIVVCSGSASFVIEIAQAFSPSRVSSLVDWFSNTLGALVGSTTAWIWKCRSADFGIQFWKEARRQPRVLALKLAVLFIILESAAPFAFVPKVERLRVAFESATWRPFEEYFIANRAADEALRAEDRQTYAWQRWRALRYILDWCVGAAALACLATLAFGVFRFDYGFGRLAAGFLAAWAGTLVAAATWATQPFIVSREWHLTDLLIRSLGAMMGAGLACLWSECARAGSPRGRRPGLGPSVNVSSRHNNSRSSTARLCGAGALVVSVYLLISQTIPWVPRPDDHLAQRAFLSPLFQPFTGYFVGRFDLSMRDLVEKLLSFALFAALMNWSAMRQSGRAPFTLAMRAILITMGLSALLETAQIFILPRVVSLTDPIVAGLGAWFGVYGAWGVAHTARCVEHAELPETHGDRPPASPLTDADRLVASLMEPRPSAPQEPTPGKQAPRRRRRGQQRRDLRVEGENPGTTPSAHDEGS